MKLLSLRWFYVLFCSIKIDLPLFWPNKFLYKDAGSTQITQKYFYTHVFTCVSKRMVILALDTCTQQKFISLNNSVTKIVKFSGY